jgi:hypothetical protein
MSARILAGRKKKRPDARRFPDDTRRDGPNRWIEPTHGHIKCENDSWQKSRWLETTVRSTHPVTAGPARHSRGRRQLHRQASEIGAIHAAGEQAPYLSLSGVNLRPGRNPTQKADSEIFNKVGRAS